MKNGDTVPVTIAGQIVAQASVKSIEDGRVTLVVPATLVVMETRTELAPPTAPVEQSPETDSHVLLGLDESNVERENEVTDFNGDSAAPAATTPVRRVGYIDENNQFVETSSIVETSSADTNVTEPADPVASPQGEPVTPGAPEAVVTSVENADA